LASEIDEMVQLDAPAPLITAGDGPVYHPLQLRLNVYGDVPPDIVTDDA
jgi:aspartate carbamoyltransferase catalytic subunit